MIKFKTDEFLGKTVKNTRIYCSIGVEPITDVFQLRYASGGNKFSSLCGFMFDTAAEKAEFPRFMISFVCKLRSRIYRQQQHNPSQWFIFRRINKNRVDVLDKKALLINYGFDIEKFFDSDLFKASIPKFEKCLKKGLEDANKFSESQKDVLIKKECARYIKAIAEAIPVMAQSKQVNNKYFQLNDLDAIAKDSNRGISADDKKKALDAKLDAIHKSAEGSMASAAKYDKKFTANDYIYKKLHGENEQNDKNSTACNEADELTKNGNPQTLQDVAMKLDDILKRYNDLKDSYALVQFKDGRKYKILGALMANGNAVLFADKKEHIDEQDSEQCNKFKNEARDPNDFKCKVEKKKEDGKDVWEVIEIATNSWVATFFDEKMAKKFAEDEYPSLKAKYLDDQDEFISKNEAEEQDIEEDDEDKLKQKELDNDIEESLKEIYK